MPCPFASLTRPTRPGPSEEAWRANDPAQQARGSDPGGKGRGGDPSGGRGSDPSQGSGSDPSRPGPGATAKSRPEPDKGKGRGGVPPGVSVVYPLLEPDIVIDEPTLVKIFSFGTHYGEKDGIVPTGHTRDLEAYRVAFLQSVWHDERNRTVLIDCRGFQNAETDTRLRSHLGSNLYNLANLASSPDFLDCLKGVKAAMAREAQSPSGTVEIACFCVRGRHRSVGIATVVDFVLRCRGYHTRLHHISAHSWPHIRDFCGACNDSEPPI